ncbi:MAG TPA: TIGR03435 family protein [Candidatus Eisenbacteria bacterium]|nr:TIGR03435 family protein [Candidatus Eisenbacteria bacterium]
MPVRLTPLLKRILSDQLGRPVLDETQLLSHYDVTFQRTTASDSQPAILTAIQEQLGLKLVPLLMPKEFLIIDHIEIPSAD